eukprot:3402263-Pyramimonas_sp.AAC.1
MTAVPEYKTCQAFLSWLSDPARGDEKHIAGSTMAQIFGQGFIWGTYGCPDACERPLVQYQNCFGFVWR